MRNKKVVIIGGGHGTSTILRGIKHIEELDISAIITVADDGGSTGRLRQYYDIPAMGDIRNVLISLADKETLIEGLMNFRFEGNDEEDIVGHNLGNLILTALTETTGSFLEAITTLSNVLNVKGEIIPSSLDLITLFAKMEDDTIVRGETNIPNKNNRIKKVYYNDPVKANKHAIDAINNADYIIYGIGSIYTSILANVIIDEIKDAINTSNAPKIYFSNVMTQPGETDDYSLEEHVQALLTHGAQVDYVVRHNDSIPNKLLNKYLELNSKEVIIRQDKHKYKILEYPLLDINNDYIRHDPNKIKECLINIFKVL